MKHRRFRVHKKDILGQEAVIADRSEIRHISRVLRLGVGDSVILFDGEGKEYHASISRLSADQVSFALLPGIPSSSVESSLKVILGVGLLKPPRFEWLLQKATELGVAEIVPFCSLRVVPRWEKTQGGTKQTRWEKIVTEAAKQCGRTRIPRVHPLRSFEEALAAEFEGAAKIFLWEKEKINSLKDAMKNSASAVFALVGPEGGFSEEEALRAQEAGFQPIRLGHRTLRAETAGVVIAGLLQFLWGDLS